MKLVRICRGLLSPKQQYIPVFVRQAGFLRQASKALCAMTETMSESQWRLLEKEIKACEVQGDALLTEFHEQLYESIMTNYKRSDLQTIAMSLDEFLDQINGSAKSILLFMPKRIDSPLKDMAQYAGMQAEALRSTMELLENPKRNYSSIVLQCDRITELEHAADDAFSEYISYIFNNEENAIEVMKYKNIAETFEAATDRAKDVSDNIRKVILRYVE